MGRITASRKMLAGDPVYGSLLASKFVNSMMWSGKKSVAQQIFYGALEQIREKIPEVGEVLDTTDHAAGRNPYYQPRR